jgi:hypothetical protein
MVNKSIRFFSFIMYIRNAQRRDYLRKLKLVEPERKKYQKLHRFGMTVWLCVPALSSLSICYAFAIQFVASG